MSINVVKLDLLLEDLFAFNETLFVSSYVKNDPMSDRWDIDINGFRAVIDFNITLKNGTYLTDFENQKLLTSFKAFIVNQHNPRFTNGTRLAKETSILALRSSINFLDFCLTNASKIHLYELGFEALTEEVVLAYILKYIEGGSSHASLNINEKLARYLRLNIDKVKESDIDFINDNFELSPFDSTVGLLDLNEEERIKSVAYLYSQGAYHSKGRLSHRVNFQYLFENVLNQRSNFFGISEKKVCCNFPELDISTGQKREYLRVPCKQDNSDKEALSNSTVTKLINTVNFIYTVPMSNPELNLNLPSHEKLNINNIRRLAEVKEAERYLTIPADIILDTFSLAYTYIHKNIDKVLNTTLSTLEFLESKGYRAPNSSGNASRGIYKVVNGRRVYPHESVHNYVSKITKGKVVSCYQYTNSDNLFEDLRELKYLSDQYNVLLGSIAYLIGCLTARRSNEIIKLKPSGNLITFSVQKNNWVVSSDPEFNNLLKNKNQRIYLTSHIGKSGEKDERESVDRPIPLMLANIIYRLENYNEKISSLNLSFPINSLLTYYPSDGLIPRPLKKLSLLYDIISDYYQLPLIKDSNGLERRYYIREHMLRRFFVQLFFWSNDSSAAEALRYQLGHVDLEHLYNYATEAIDGAALNSVKAQLIATKMVRHNLKEEKELKKKLANIYNIQPHQLRISTGAKAKRSYAKGFITSLTPEELDEVNKLEPFIVNLLTDEEISLEPDFFTVEKDGEVLNKVNFVLEVKDGHE